MVYQTGKKLLVKQVKIIRLKQKKFIKILMKIVKQEKIMMNLKKKEKKN